MKKVLLLALIALICVGTVDAKTKSQKAPKAPKVQKAQKTPKVKKDVLTDKEYEEYKKAYFNAEGYGDTYNCWTEQQRFCKVKVLSTGTYVLCDRDVSRTQWESSKIFNKYGRCTKLN